MVLHNYIQLIGRVGHDPELVTLSDGTPRASLRLYQDAAGGRDSGQDTQVHSLVGWHGLATQLHRRARRGDTLLVHGKLVNRKLTVNGTVLVKAEIHLSEFRLLSSRSITRSVGIAAEPVHPFTVNHE
ncbi:single-stranded DNA-binding protein [Neolewinella sp.]|uniref:single-stranded DNA-binding protein n=1 Tax=Neolewinella sp. TaxID=2993543 RepID=UPI003B526FA5